MTRRWRERFRRHHEVAPVPGPFISSTAWWPTDDPSIERFCNGAFLVDGYAPRSFFGSRCLALRAHLPVELAHLDLVNSMDDLENLRETFYTLVGADGAVRFWRCNVDWIQPEQRVYSIAGTCDETLLAEMSAARYLTPVEASIWDNWEWIDAPHTIENDPAMWLRCSD